MSSRKQIVFLKHARERMVERGISHKEVEDAITNGVKFIEANHIRAIHEVKKDRFVTVIYLEQRKHWVVLTAYESGLSDVRYYRRARK